MMAALKIVLLFGGLLGFWYGLQVLLFRIEKYKIWPYGQPQDDPHYPDPTGYGARRLSEAVEVGFSFLGWVPDIKGKQYQTTYAMLISPDQTCFVLIGIGKVLRMPVQGTWMYTATTDNRVFYSVDHQSCVETDLSGTWFNQLCTAREFGHLWDKHRTWIERRNVVVRPFTEGREIEEFRAIRNERITKLWNLGLITFVESSSEQWRYTTRAAMKLAYRSYAVALLRGITGGRFPKTA